MTIDHETLEYLAELGRIRIDKKDESKLLHDLENIIAYFDELKEVDTKGVEPLAGGTVDNNIFRDDEESSKLKVKSSKLTGAFPEEEKGFLKVPAVFE